MLVVVVVHKYITPVQFRAEQINFHIRDRIEWFTERIIYGQVKYMPLPFNIEHVVKYSVKVK